MEMYVFLSGIHLFSFAGDFSNEKKRKKKPNALLFHSSKFSYAISMNIE